MALVDRAKNMILSPATEWQAIANEPPVAPATLYTSYIIPLALIPPVCAIISGIGLSMFTHGTIIAPLVVGVLSFVLELVMVFVVALIAKTLAPSFNGTGDQDKALKWIAYAYTPRWIGGIGLLIPILGLLISLVGSLYSLYVLYLGAGPMMQPPQDKAIGYVVVVVLVAIVVGVIIGSIAAVVGATFAVGSLVTSGALHSHY